jgi:rubrerythrin
MKMKILIIDATGVVAGPLSAEMKAEGWTIRTCADPKKLPKTAGGCDGVFLAVAAGELATRLPGAIRLARKSGAPLLLATNLDRSGWDRTFESADALEVDALFDLPVEPAAVVRRLKGIAEARGPAAERGARKTPAGASIISRAVANEEAAQAFYARAAKSVTRKDTKETLEALARDEKEHKRLLTEFKKGRGALPSEPAAAGAVLENLSVPDFSPDMTPADAFLLAARKEKLAADFYESWASMYPEGPERELLHRLAEVERRHKAWVEGMFTNASFPERW